MAVSNIKILVTIIASFLWFLIGGFSVIVIGISEGIPDYILKNPCWLIVIFLAFKGVCVWTDFIFKRRLELENLALLRGYLLYFTNPVLLIPFSVATYLYRCNGDQIHMGYFLCVLTLFVLNNVSRLIVFIRWHRIEECDKSLLVRLSQSSKANKVAWAVLSVETLLMICLFLANMYRGK